MSRYLDFEESAEGGIFAHPFEYGIGMERGVWIALIHSSPNEDTGYITKHGGVKNGWGLKSFYPDQDTSFASKEEAQAACELHFSRFMENK